VLETFKRVSQGTPGALVKPQTWIWVVGFGFLVGCSAGEGQNTDESDLGSIQLAYNKGSPYAKNGQYNYCFPTTDPALLCTLGEGYCHSNAECASGLICGWAKLPQYLAGGQGNACTYTHCTNGVYEPALGETQKDCGGECGTLCPNLCAGRPANGLAGHCSSDCPCPAGQGDCNLDSECQTGLFCSRAVGESYGFAATTDVCVGTNCSNGIQDGTETGIDCGGSCKPCGGTAASAKSFGTSTTLETPNDIAFARNGTDFVVAGRFNGTVNFGCGNLTAAGSTKADVYAAKYDSTGKCLWSVSGGSVVSNDGDYGVSVAVDPSDSVYVAGNFYDTSTFLGQSLTVNGVTDIFVMKFSSVGALQWIKGFGGAGIDRVGGIAAWGAGVTVGGDFEQSIQFGSTTLTSAGSSDAYLLSLDASGNVKWAKRYGGAGADQIHGVAVNIVDASNYAVGQFWNGVDFGTGTLTSAGRADAFAMMASSAGATAWANRYGGTGDDVAVDVGFTTNGPIVGGYFSNSVDFGSGTASTATKVDGFGLALTTAGAYRWHQVLTGPDNEEVRAVGTNLSGNLTLTGRYTTSMNWGAGSVAAAGASDLFVVTYTPAGALKWGRSFGSTGGDVGDGVAIGKTLVRGVGRIAGTVNFDLTPLTAGGTYDEFSAGFQL
jgi:hypothetical protein